MIEVFLSYAAADEDLRKELRAHLRPLEREGIVRVWDARGLGAGGTWREERDARLRSARVVVLLVSPDYLASDVLYADEMMPALARQREGEAVVVPVLVRACDWESAPFPAHALLPRDQRPVTSWEKKDEAWDAVVKGIREAIGHRTQGAARAPNNLRVRNPYFRGRGEELADLVRVLATERAATITHASVLGLGGVGKTALALEFCHRAVEQGDYPGGVWWVAAEGSPVDALVRFAPVLRANAPAEVKARLPEEEMRAEVIAEQVRVALQGQRAPSLLVLDNVSEPWGDHIPGGAVRVLATMRDASLAIGEVRRLEVLSKEQAREVAKAIAGKPQNMKEEEARDRVVVSELGGLAVAVEMAANAVKKWFVGSWTKYEQMLHKEMENLFEDPKLYGEYKRGVFAAIDLSIEKCDAEARMLLEGAAVLAPEALPKEWALAAAGMEAGALSDLRATAALKELGLVTVDEDKGLVSMHRLVHRRVRARANASNKDGWEDVIARGVKCVAQWIRHTVQGNPTRDEMATVDARRQHIDEARSLAGKSQSDLELVWIANGLAVHMHNRAQYDESLELYERILMKAEKLTPLDPSQPAQILSNMGTLCRELGRTTEARQLTERALIMIEATQGCNHPEVAIVLANLAFVHQALGQHLSARTLLERALAIDEATYGHDHPNVARRLSGLAMIDLGLGRFASALALIKRVLVIDETRGSLDHPDHAIHLSILALLYGNLGQPVAARPLLERALSIAEATYGPDHPNVAKALSNLAMVHKDLGQPAAARPLLDRALAIDEATYGPDHPAIAVDLSNLAMVHKALGQPAAARPLLERAIAIAEAKLPPDHPNLTLYREGLASLGPPGG